MSKEAKCKTCKDKKKVEVCDTCYPNKTIQIMQQIDSYPKLIRCVICGKGKPKEIPCPDCQQPKAGEWTKKTRKDFAEYYECPDWAIQEKLIEACDRLDSAEASRKDLLGLCEEFMERADNGAADFDDPEPGSIYLRAKAAIAKAKKEGDRE